MKVTANREYKDSLFKIIFGENKKNALALYNAINGTDYTDEDDIIMTTIKGAVYVRIKNDVSFIFDDVMNLFEHQSDINYNMPLRGLEYFGILYSDFIESLEGGHRNVYRRKAIKIPTPKYYVFYNGNEDQPDKITMRLSDAYEGPGDVEVIAHMLNINYNRNKKLLEACRPLSEYQSFVIRVRHYQEEGYEYEKAIDMAVDGCLEDGVLTEILEKEKNRVISSILREFTEEEKELLYQERGFEKGYDEGYEKGQAEGREEGRAEGREEGREEGQESLIALLSKLKEEGKDDEIEKVIADAEYRKELLERYDLR